MYKKRTRQWQSEEAVVRERNTDKSQMSNAAPERRSR
jgi:hypothetical protein